MMTAKKWEMSVKDGSSVCTLNDDRNWQYEKDSFSVLAFSSLGGRGGQEVKSEKEM